MSRARDESSGHSEETGPRLLAAPVSGARIAAVAPAIELRQLRHFVAIAEALHFGRAAERLHMSQPPLSRATRELERDLGVVLFLGTTRHVELTPAGVALLERARRALAEVDQAVDDARRAAGQAVAMTIGHGPLSREVASRIAGCTAAPAGVRLDHDLTPIAAAAGSGR